MNLEEYNQQHKYWKEDDDRVWAEIEFEILMGTLCEFGWTKVILSPVLYERSAEIDCWISKECVGKHETMGLVWLFKDAKDAIMFTLRWA